MSLGSTTDEADRADRLTDQIIEAMTGSMLIWEDNARAALDELLGLHHCASCDGHSCE